MKTCSFYLLLLITVTSCNQIGKKNTGQDSLAKDIQLNGLDRTNVFEALFKPEITGLCVWKPTKADSVFPVSKDGYCHTRLDTIIKYRQDTTQMAIMVFSTYNIELGTPEELTGGQPDGEFPIRSIAVAAKNNADNWSVLSFKKNFGFVPCGGHMWLTGLPNLQISKLGNYLFLKEEGSNTGQGYTEGWTTYWHLPSLVESLKLAYNDNFGTLSEERDLRGVRDSISDISDARNTKILWMKIETTFSNGKTQDKVMSKNEYMFNDSCIFRPVTK